MLLLHEIVKVTDGKVISQGPLSFRSLSIDSRTIEEDEVFLALKGKRFDGHDFLDDALKKGSGAIVSNLSFKIEGSRFNGKTIIVVEDTLKALQQIARYLRKRYIKLLTGITGSNGKTTTKEMLFGIISLASAKAIKSEGNLNNEIGLPLSIIRGVSRSLGDIDYGVFEMGASRQGDITLLSEISLPDFGLITSIGHAHLEGMGGIEGVFKTETEIVPFVKVLFINGDDPYLRRLRGTDKEPYDNIITFGLKEGLSVRAEDIFFRESSSKYRLVASMKDHSSREINTEMEIEIAVPGMGNIYNSLGSASVALYLGMPSESIKKGLESFRGVKLRLEIKDIEDYKFIIDTYNANPDSMKNAVRELIRIKKTRAIAVLGDMLELGPYSETLHRELGRFLYESGLDIFIAVGKEMESAFDEFVKLMGSGTEAFYAKDIREARERLYSILKPQDTVLLKGSRLMQMERLVNSEENTSVEKETRVEGEHAG